MSRGIAILGLCGLLAACGSSNTGTGGGAGGGGGAGTDAGQADGGATDTAQGQDAATAADAGSTGQDVGGGSEDSGRVVKVLENTDELCSDGKDNDNNGYTDCDDFGCSKNDKVTVCGGGNEKCGDGKCTGEENAKTCPKDCGKAGPNSCIGKCGAYDDTASCQCDDGCHEFDDCCDDYKQVCGGGPTGTGSCKDRCGDFDANAKCQCDSTCKDFDDCCPDFAQLCSDVTGTTGGGGGDSGTIVISELMVRSQSGTDDGEWIELHNPASATVDIDGWELVYKDTVKVTLSKKTGKTAILGGGYLVIGRSSDASKNHGAPVDYAQKTIGLGNSGGKLALVNGKTTVDLVNYPKESVVLGVAWQLSAGKLNAKDNDNPKSWCGATAEYGTAKKKGTPGAANAMCK